MKVALYPSSLLIPAGLLITGWTVENKAHWIVADVVGFIPIFDYMYILLSYYRASSSSEPVSYSCSKAFRHTLSIRIRCIPLPVSPPFESFAPGRSLKR